MKMKLVLFLELFLSFLSEPIVDLFAEFFNIVEHIISPRKLLSSNSLIEYSVSSFRLGLAQTHSHLNAVLELFNPSLILDSFSNESFIDLL
jgi:hypothetical protein